MKRHVMYVTGTRADFGLMVSTLRAIHAHPLLRVSIVMTGMHLDPEFGDTAQEIRATSLPIVGEVPTPIGERSGLAMAQAVGYATVGLANVIVREQPDVVLLLGDRGEMLAGAIAALHIGIPIAHIHGGDRSGTVDEPIRHAITKLSHFHFVATE
ncbi:MAG: UDP-N-acetylglucosamine 2-epimerase, partial [Planctomycetota bacterium]